MVKERTPRCDQNTEAINAVTQLPIGPLSCARNLPLTPSVLLIQTGWYHSVYVKGVKSLPSCFVDIWNWITTIWDKGFYRNEPYKSSKWQLSVAFRELANQICYCCIKHWKLQKTLCFEFLKMPRPLFHRNGYRDPFQEKTQNLFNQNIDLPSFLKPDEVSWIESAKKRLGVSTGPGSILVPLFSPLCMEVPPKPCTGSEDCVSEALCEQMGHQNWKICLDISPFSLKEINIKTKEGYLEITGNHEERQENCRMISRSFTRKYKLPADLDQKHISSMLSPDGILSVEAPIPGSNISLPGEIVIPVHMMDKQSSAKSDEQCPTSKK